MSCALTSLSSTVSTIIKEWLTTVVGAGAADMEMGLDPVLRRVFRDAEIC